MKSTEKRGPNPFGWNYYSPWLFYPMAAIGSFMALGIFGILFTAPAALVGVVPAFFPIVIALRQLHLKKPADPKQGVGSPDQNTERSSALQYSGREPQTFADSATASERDVAPGGPICENGHNLEAGQSRCAKCGARIKMQWMANAMASASSVPAAGPKVLSAPAGPICENGHSLQAGQSRCPSCGARIKMQWMTRGR